VNWGKHHFAAALANPLSKGQSCTTSRFPEDEDK
jgi:hypothetical protein